MNKNNRLTVSIAMCTYNGEKYLHQQLESFLHQTWLPDEIIICDDGSSDETITILQDFAKKAPFSVSVIQNDNNLGYTKNFEKSASLCKGDVVFFSDQDDVWLPNKIQKVMELFESQPDVGLVLMNAELIDETGKRIEMEFSKRFFRKSIFYWDEVCRKNQGLMVCKIILSHWYGMAMVYRNQYANILYPIPNNHDGHDAWIFKILGAITKIHIVTEPLVQYRLHGNNTCNKEIKPSKSKISGAFSSNTVNFFLRVSNDMSLALECLQLKATEISNSKVIELYTRKCNHFRIRYQIRTKQINKLYYILQETLNGNYFQFGHGILSIGVDLLS